MIVIDSEFESLIPPLTDDEYKLLEESILTEGYHAWEPIVTWNGTIIDGHNRYHICDKHGIKFTTKDVQFDSRDAAKIWIIKHQFRRRNLSSGQRAALAIDLHEAQVREQARMRKKNNGGDKKSSEYRQKIGGAPVSPSDFAESQPTEKPEEQKGRTAEILGDMAGVGHMTIKRAMKVKQEDEELYDKVRKGEIPVTTAYNQVTENGERKRGPKPQFTEDGRRKCTICGEPIDEGDSYESDPGRHKKCRNQRLKNSQYKNPDKALIENVAVYDVNSLIRELTSCAEMLRDSITESIEINETMGVRISNKKKKQLDRAISHVFKAIESIDRE